MDNRPPIQLIACSRCGAQNDPASIICVKCAFGLASNGIEDCPTLLDGAARPKNKPILHLDSSISDPSDVETDLDQADADADADPGASTDCDPLVGLIVGDRYRILEPLGRGGMGVVYKIEHVELHKLLALKLLAGDLGRDRMAVRRFKREALLASKLSHPNTVQVFDYGTSDGLTFLVMELIHGQDLSKLLRTESVLSVERMARIIVQVCSSLAEAHNQAIVHRDIKLGNIMISRTRDGTEIAKVLDFGLAKLREAPTLSEVTTRGAVVGTPAYMAPEQIQGKAVDGRTDLYALGMVMYRLVTGDHVFRSGSPLSIFSKQLTEIPEAPHLRRPDLDIPEFASQIILRCIEKNPQDRYQLVEDLQKDLIRLVEVTSAQSGDVLLSASKIQGLADNVLREVATEAESIVRRSTQRPTIKAIATRDEVAAFKRRLEVQKWITRAIVTALLSAASFAGLRIYKTVTANPVFSGFELEPNNHSGNATNVPFGATAKATIGRRLDSDRSDRDFYRVIVPPGNGIVSLHTSALPNMAMCTMVYGDDAELRAKYCVGRPGQPLSVDALRLEPGAYFFAVLQDRERYGAPITPLVVENISDEYEFRVGPAQYSPEQELEPNDAILGASIVGPSGKIRGKLDWSGDVDVVCAGDLPAEKRYQWVVSDGEDKVRDRGTVLEASATAGPNAGLAVRIHNANAQGKVTPEDALSPYAFAPPFVVQGQKSSCIRLRLTTDPWLKNETAGPHPGEEPWHLRIVPVN